MREFVVHVGHFDTAYELHQKVWEVVRRAVGDGIRFLFREAGGYVKVRHSANDFGRPLLAPEQGKTYSFEVLVNPLKSSTALGKKVPVASAGEAVAITKRRLENAGFRVEAIQGSFLRGAVFGKPGTKPFRRRSFLASGTVTVADREKAVAAMLCGIGAGKRFGFGMIDLEERK